MSAPVPPAPVSTYRLQFHAGFTFQGAAQLAPYLRELGISHLYASPYLRARSGSTHGYDVADPSALNPELGSEQDFDHLVKALQGHGLGQLVDIVPNHMGIGDPGNYRWRDVLENGPASIYARFFDINWHPLSAQGQSRPKLVVPTLGDQYGKVLENGELSVEYADGAFALAYYDHRFPVAPDSYTRLLEDCRERLEEELGRRHEHVQELASIETALRHLPPREQLDAEAMEERNREKEIVKRRIRELYAASAPFRQALSAVLDEINGQHGDPSSYDRLDALIDDQSYRLAFWRVAAEEINYRRFFDINELAAVRMEDPSVFQDTHRLLLRLISEGAIQGLRVDHPDGLRDPARYFDRLQQSCQAASAARPLGESTHTPPAPRSLSQGAGGVNGSSPSPVGGAHVNTPSPEDRGRGLGGGGLTPQAAAATRRFYLVVEKILSDGEQLPTSWPISGTTGYDFLNEVNGLFVNRRNKTFFDTIYFRFLRQGAHRFEDLVNSTKKMVMLISLASEVNELAYALKEIASSDRRHRDFTLNSLAFVIREVIAALGIYRTYIDPETGAASPADVAAIEQAVAEAKRRNPRTDPSIFEYVGDTLLLRGAEELSPEAHAQCLGFIARFQQTTGPVMAKGAEDTAFYVFNRLISLNEVGGNPDHFGRSLADFHRHNLARAQRWPATLVASSTHDTKRSEDVRARINVLSELPRDWRAALTRWSRLNGRKKVLVEGRAAPDRNEEYLLYQTLLGVWPAGGSPDDAFRDRVCQFMLKALKEAKVHTSWITPNSAYEEAVLQFVRAILDERESAPFLDDFRMLQTRVAFFGVFNSLSQTLLKLGSPGVCDIYQGQELWDYSLVDPDNRRPVDFALRARLLRSLGKVADSAALARELLQTREDGRIKLHVTQRLLCLRREQPELFGSAASYVPLRALGERDLGQHVAAFARVAGGASLVVAAPVLVATLTRGASVVPVGADVWRDGYLPVPGERGRPFRNLFTGATLDSTPIDGHAALPLAEVFRDFPVAALLSR